MGDVLTFRPRRHAPPPPDTRTRIEGALALLLMPSTSLSAPWMTSTEIQASKTAAMPSRALAYLRVATAK